jgi:uncharacterized HAD superfamily protein
MRIGLDIDGVMYQWERTARYMLREVLPDSPYGKSGPLGRTQQSWNFIQEGVSREHWNWLWTEGVKLGLFRHSHLYPGTIQAVRQLAEIGDVVCITHRPKQAVHDTLAWLSYQNLPLAGLHILTSQEPKSTVRPMCDVYLDDKPENIDDLLNKTKARVALRVQQWNHNYNRRHPRLGYVYEWGDFINFVKDGIE